MANDGAPATGNLGTGACPAELSITGIASETTFAEGGEPLCQIDKGVYTGSVVDENGVIQDPSVAATAESRDPYAGDAVAICENGAGSSFYYVPVRQGVTFTAADIRNLDSLYKPTTQGQAPSPPLAGNYAVVLNAKGSQRGDICFDIHDQAQTSAVYKRLQGSRCEGVFEGPPDLQGLKCEAVLEDLYEGIRGHNPSSDIPPPHPEGAGALAVKGAKAVGALATVVAAFHYGGKLLTKFDSWIGRGGSGGAGSGGPQGGSGLVDQHGRPLVARTMLETAATAVASAAATAAMHTAGYAREVGQVAQEDAVAVGKALPYVGAGLAVIGLGFLGFLAVSALLPAGAMVGVGATAVAGVALLFGGDDSRSNDL